MNEETPYLVWCPNHGRVFLTFDQYVAQMDAPDSKWACPDCGETARWDDDNYERHMQRLQEAADEPEGDPT